MSLQTTNYYTIILLCKKAQIILHIFKRVLKGNSFIQSRIFIIALNFNYLIFFFFQFISFLRYFYSSHLIQYYQCPNTLRKNDNNFLKISVIVYVYNVHRQYIRKYIKFFYRLSRKNKQNFSFSHFFSNNNLIKGETAVFQNVCLHKL